MCMTKEGSYNEEKMHDEREEGKNQGLGREAIKNNNNKKKTLFHVRSCTLQDG